MWKLPIVGILCHCCQSSLKQNLAMPWGQWQQNSKQCMPWPNSWPKCMTAWKIITPRSLQKLEKGSSASIWLWSLQLKVMTQKIPKTGIANPNAICLAISVTEPVKAGTLKIPGITGMRRSLSVWQKWDSREVVQIANPWQKQSSSDGCPSRTGLLSSMKQNTPSLKKLLSLTKAVSSLRKAIFRF